MRIKPVGSAPVSKLALNSSMSSMSYLPRASARSTNQAVHARSQTSVTIRAVLGSP